MAEHRLTTAIRPQINAFLDGFNELISRDLISIFHDKELELLISGLPDIDCEFPLSSFFFNIYILFQIPLKLKPTVFILTSYNYYVFLQWTT